jgi:hypothetical protein
MVNQRHDNPPPLLAKLLPSVHADVPPMVERKRTLKPIEGGGNSGWVR